MTITTRHKSSHHGHPVILDDAGELLETGVGIRAIRDKWTLSTQDIAAITGHSHRTVEDWEQCRRTVPAAALNALRDWMEDQDS